VFGWNFQEMGNPQQLRETEPFSGNTNLQLRETAGTSYGILEEVW
jgi:hypothetical protein